MSIDIRLALPVLIAWVTVGLLISLPRSLAAAALIGWAAALLLMIAMMIVRGAKIRSTLAGIVVALAATALLLSLAAVRAPERQPALLLDAAGSGRYVTTTATLTQPVGDSAAKTELSPANSGPARRVVFSARLDEVTVGKRTLSASIPATIFATQPHQKIGIGAKIFVSGTLSATDPADAVAMRLFAVGELQVIDAAPWYLQWANELRYRFLRTATALPGDGGDLLPGLAIGVTSAVSEPLDSAMKTTSLSHLTAVSGANCAVVIALVMLVGAACGVPRGLRIGASLLTLLGFVVLVTPEPSVLRAAVMAVIVLATLATGRPVRGLPTLALASFLLLLNDPWLARSYGFILSVLATAGLLLLAGPFTRILARRMPRWLAVAIAVPAAAQLACQPVLILLSPNLPTYGVIANVLAEPAAPVATVLGLIACVTLPVLPMLGQAVAALAWVPSAWVAAVATFFAGLPGAAIPWVPGATGVALIALITVLLLLTLLVRRFGAVRRITGVMLAVMLAGSTGIVGGHAIGQQISRPANWQIAGCDVGQGDAFLVRSLGKVALIDTGRDPKLLRRCLAELSITRIDLLVLTHWDIDHVGGYAAVLGLVDQALIGPNDGAKGTKIAESLAQHGANLRPVSQGEKGLLGELGWEILWPKAVLGSVKPGNDASVTMRFTPAGDCAAGCLSSIFLGDLGMQPQAIMMAANSIGRVDVVKVAHHGSADQNPRLYQALQATVGVIGVGVDNDYGHPTPSLLKILADSGTRASRTDRDGMILLSPAADGAVRVWSEKPAVAASGRPPRASGLPWPRNKLEPHQQQIGAQEVGDFSGRQEWGDLGNTGNENRDHHPAAWLGARAAGRGGAGFGYRRLSGRTGHPQFARNFEDTRRKS